MTQDKLDVNAYSREFGRLARYAPEKVSMDAKKQARFRKGLNPKLRHDLSLHEFISFEVLVNKAIQAETSRMTYEESCKHNRDVGSSSTSISQKRRIWIPNAVITPRYVPRPTYVAPRLPMPSVPHDNLINQAFNLDPSPIFGSCFKRSKPGHYSRDCPCVVLFHLLQEWVLFVASHQPGSSRKGQLL